MKLKIAQSKNSKKSINFQFEKYHKKFYFFLSQISAASNPYAAEMQHSSSLLLDAKKELQKEKALLASLKNQQGQNINNTSGKDGEDAEMKDAENGHESMSEDESDDDSDRKGKKKQINFRNCES